MAEGKKRLANPDGKPGKIVDIMAAQGDYIGLAEEAGQQGARESFRKRQMAIEQIDAPLEAMGCDELPDRKVLKGCPPSGM